MLLSRLDKHGSNSNPLSHTNYWYLTDLEKNGHLKELHRNNRIAQRKIAHLKEKLTEKIEIEGEQVDDLTNTDLKEIMDENDSNIEALYSKDSFIYLFWRQQKEALIYIYKEKPKRNEMASTNDQMVLVSPTSLQQSLRGSS